MFDDTTTQLSKGLGDITCWVKTWGIPLAAIGTISMALIQTAKNVFPLRRRFQEKRLRTWLQLRSSSDSALAQQDLVRLATANDPDAFYNSDIEQLCGQIKNALNTVLDYPHLHVALILCLASTASREDVDVLLHPPHPDIFLKPAHLSSAEEKAAIRQYAAAKTRLGAEMRCAIDAIQNSIGFRWKKKMQMASLLLSALIGVIALQLGSSLGIRRSFGASIIIGLLAGFLAPIARDLVAAVENWRG